MANSTIESTDILIIGGGPAGSAAGAYLHKRGQKVLCLEAGWFPRFVIGESLLPRCNDLLEEAGLLDAVKARNYIVKPGAAFLRGDEIERFPFSDALAGDCPTTFQVPRDDFDQTLATEARRQGLDLRFGHRVEAIRFDDEGATAQVSIEGSSPIEVRARFVIDCSGYGRVLPRLLDLERPALLPRRVSCFTHFEKDARPEGSLEGEIWVCMHPVNGWIWIIPFSNGRTSVGLVCDGTYWDALSGNAETRLMRYLREEPNAERRLREAAQVAPVRVIDGYSKKVDRLHGPRWVVVGNASDFLDPVFSSGVTLALESSLLAAKLAERTLAGQAVDWDSEYDAVLGKAVGVFLNFVEAWYRGELPTIFFHPKKSDEVRRRVASVLGGYVLKDENPFVRIPREYLQTLHRLVGGKAA